MGGKPKSFGAKGAVSITVKAPGKEAEVITSPKVAEYDTHLLLHSHRALCTRNRLVQPGALSLVATMDLVTCAKCIHDYEEQRPSIDAERPVYVEKEAREWTRRELSTLVYVETRAVDYRGIIDHRHVNDEDMKHLDDLEEHGLLVNMGTGVNRMYKLTDEGWRVVRPRAPTQGRAEPRGP